MPRRNRRTIFEVFTDISVAHRQRTGYAVYFGDGDPRNQKGCIKDTKVVQSETQAIAIACEIIADSSQPFSTRWIVYCDCRDAVLRPAGCYPMPRYQRLHGPPDIDNRIGSSIHAILAKGHTIEFEWIKRRSMEGNIKADKMAGEAAMDAYYNVI